MLKQVNACVVQAASPRADHLRWTEKANLKHFRWYIKPSPLEESLMIKRLHDTNTTDEQWTEFFEKYGPSTRLLVSYAETPDLFDAALNDKLVPVSSAGLRDLLFPSSGNNVTQEEVSHWICGINPGPCRNQPYGTFHTPTILRMVKERYKEQWIKEVEWAYTIFKSNPYTRVPAGHILEDRVHDVLVNGGCWKMVKLSGNSKGSTNNIYRIPEAPLNRWLVVSSAGVRVEETRPLNPTGPLELHWFRDIKSIDRYKMGYYRPRKPNQPTLDAYIVNPLDKSVFMIQITIAKDHDAKQEGSEDLRVNYLGYTFYYIVVADELDIAIKMPKEADRMWESRWCLLADEDMLFPKQVSASRNK
ncbi:hypothetical protein K435DRAFT_312349 [Dendrothele bispora CBS 962.96]|uniref:Uncharacterized protein n=1 Tax=Dendrothele bispora (strain CBS 962.96) TaxID=1314807 RepID=A0A4S8LI46_DENBC|nr:hypothetical protein K435DRAFT_312349 [Dendrothele bispora CBS 962.96]